MPQIASGDTLPDDMLLITRGVGSMHMKLSTLQILLSANINLANYNLDRVSNTSDLEKPISTAAQRALDLKADLVEGKVPASQLPGFVDTIEEFPRYIDFPTVGLPLVIYVDATTGHTYRWSGSMYASVGGSISLGDTNGQAFDGARGLISYTHVTDGTNPHNVTKADLGLENVDNTSDANKPMNSITSDALNLKANKVDLDLHKASISNPHSVDKGQIGLGYVDNTSDLAKPVSTATGIAIDARIPKTDIRQTVGLVASVDSSKLVISEAGLIELKLYFNGQVDALSGRITALSSIAAPTKITLGLDLVDNTSDLNKPISTLQQNALDLKADLVDGKVPLAQLPEQSALSGYSNLASFPAVGVAGIIYIAYDTNILYRWDGATTAYVPISTTVGGSTAHLQVGLVAGTAYDGVLGAQLNLDARAHFINVANPHGVTQAQVGLDQVDNTADMDKPISDTVTAALLLKQDVSTRVVTVRPVADASHLHYPTEKAVATALQGIGSYIGEFANEGEARAAGQPGDLWSLSNGTVKVVRDPADYANTLTLLEKIELITPYEEGFVLVYELSGGVVQVEYITPFNRTVIDINSIEDAKYITVDDTGVKVFFDNKILYTTFNNDGWVRELVTPLMNFVGLVGDIGYYTSTTLPDLFVLVDSKTGVETQIAAFDRFRKVIETPAGIFTIAEDGNVYSILNGDVLIGEFGNGANFVVDGIWIYAFTPNSSTETYKVLNTASRVITEVPYPQGVTSLEIDDDGQVFDHTVIIKSGIDYGWMILGFDAQVAEIHIESDIRSRKYRVNLNKGLYFSPLDNVLHLVKLALL